LPVSSFQSSTVRSISLADEVVIRKEVAVQDYRKLVVWQKAHKLALATYELSAYYRAPDAWALRDQTLRAALSIPSNIAEGAGRGTTPDFRRFLWHSLGSCNELEYDLQLARDAGFLPADRHRLLDGQVAEVRRMLIGLVKNMRA
jgi:four helix bundle protein